MTRINAHIKPKHLLDQHLLAEYREIVRIPNVVKADLTNAYKKVKLAPPTFKLSTGHVIYFYDKIKFLHARFLALKQELDCRGIENNMSDEMFLNVPSNLYNDLVECDLANDLVAHRIIERATGMKSLKYYKKEITLTEYLTIINKYVLR